MVSDKTIEDGKCNISKDRQAIDRNIDDSVPQSKFLCLSLNQLWSAAKVVVYMGPMEELRARARVLARACSFRSARSMLPARLVCTCTEEDCNAKRIESVIAPGGTLQG